MPSKFIPTRAKNSFLFSNNNNCSEEEQGEEEGEAPIWWWVDSVGTSMGHQENKEELEPEVAHEWTWCRGWVDRRLIRGRIKSKCIMQLLRWTNCARKEEEIWTNYTTRCRELWTIAGIKGLLQMTSLEMIATRRTKRMNTAVTPSRKSPRSTLSPIK